MPRINFTKRTIHAKVVYYGPEGAGSTASIEFVNRRAPAKGDSRLTSVTSEAPFEFMPMKLGRFDGMDTTLYVYTVPHGNEGQVRQSVMRDADVVIFVADSQRTRMRANTRALADLRKDLRALGKKADDVPVVFQWNKRDLPNVVDVATLEAALNPGRSPSFATSTVGDDLAVLATLKKASLLALENVAKTFGLTKTRAVRRPVAARNIAQKFEPVEDTETITTTRGIVGKIERTTKTIYETVRPGVQPAAPRQTVRRSSSSARLKAMQEQNVSVPTAKLQVVGVTKRRKRLFWR